MILDGFIFLVNHTGYQTIGLAKKLYELSQPRSGKYL